MKYRIFILMLCCVVLLTAVSCSDAGSEESAGASGTRVSEFLNAHFAHSKLVEFGGDAYISGEMNQLLFAIGVHEGGIYQYPLHTREGITNEQIEENIANVFGREILAKLDYSFIPAEYDANTGKYTPSEYSARAAYVYFALDVWELSEGVFRAVVAYTEESNGVIVAFDADGNRVIYEAVESLYEAGERDRARGELEGYVRNAPEKYETMAIVVDFNEGGGHILSAELIGNG